VSHILDDLEWRGLLQETTDRDELRAALDAGPVTFYVGFDPTAPSLHFGHLVQVLTAKRLQLAGHLPLALVGGATGLIGDPKETGERSMNDPSVVAGWVERIQRQIEPFLDFAGPQAAVMVNNLDWTAPLSAIELLRDIGKHFSVNRMLDREAVAARLATTGISYTEFSYVILQSNDYLQLHRLHGCTLQLGGSDQWGNITAGCELIRRVEGERVHALATPLITKADGTKFGKTESGTIWLDPTMTSPYAFYQFWLNAEDVTVGALLRIFSFRSSEEIKELEASHGARPQAREAQRALAEEVTTLVHGGEACAQAVAASKALFGQGDLLHLAPETLEAALREAPHVEVAPDATPSVVDLLADAGLVTSRSAARRAIDEGGAYVNNVRVADPDAVIAPDQWLHGRYVVLRRGKRTVGGAVRTG
jgi:tyrosyl-tRNA synthetase